MYQLVGPWTRKCTSWLLEIANVPAGCPLDSTKPIFQTRPDFTASAWHWLGKGVGLYKNRELQIKNIVSTLQKIRNCIFVQEPASALTV
jgi:hypothetical protein